MSADKDQRIRELLEEKNRLLDLMAKKEVEDRANKVPANFVQISRSSMKEIRSLSDRNNLAFKILMLFGEKMNRQNSIIISQKAMCQLLDRGRTAVHNAIKLLTQEKWIKIIKVGTANAYVINEKVFWTTDLKKRKYAVFSASVIAAESEQETTAEEWEKIETKNFPFIDISNERAILDTKEDLPPPDQKDMDLA